MPDPLRRDFFVSFTHADRQWAGWVAWVLELNGYTVYFQDWDFEPGSNFIAKMHEATRNSDTTLLVLSEDFLQSGFAALEWTAALAQDPVGQKRKLLPVRVRPCEPEGMLRQIVYVDLVDLSETDAQAKLLVYASAGRKKPDGSVPFPGRPSQSLFPPAKLAVESGHEPVFWAYLVTPFGMSEHDALRIISAAESMGSWKVLRAEDHESLDLLRADIALFIAAPAAVPGQTHRFRTDLQIAIAKRIPHRVYLPADASAIPEEILDGLTDPSASESGRPPSVYANLGSLQELIVADITQARRGLRMAGDIDFHQSGEHREILIEMRKGRYETAHDLCVQLVARRPYSPRGRYNLACIFSRQAGKTKDSFSRNTLLAQSEESLATALKYGFVEFVRDTILGSAATRQAAIEHILNDPDLETLFADRPDLRGHLTGDELTKLFPAPASGLPYGCVEGSMPVELAGGEVLRMAELSAGDAVVSWNEEHGRVEGGSVQWIQRHLSSELLIINHSLRVTPLHPFLTPSGWQRAAHLVQGEELLRSDGTTMKVMSKTYVFGEFCVWDFHVTPRRNLSIRGFVVHNKC